MLFPVWVLSAVNLMKKNICVGIDLGTTNSEICVIEQGKSKLIKIDGNPVIPSVVSINKDDSVLIGHEAINNLTANPENTISLIKRKMGKEIILKINEKDFTPPMISSLILSRLKLAAESYLNAEVTQAVITVPAFFNEQQREATKQAGELAGLEVVRLLNEPTAAALAYSLGRKTKEKSLIYDLGGGTFDVSIVDLSHDTMEVLASEGDTELGGSDFDLMIAQRANLAFIEQTGIDLSKNARSWTRLLQAAEKAKIRLSTESDATLIEEFIYEKEGQSHHLSHRITRVEFENMITKQLEKTLDSVKRAMTQASLTKEQLDRVILVGGSTYIPLVSELLQKELSIVPQSWIDPALVVAIGASIEASNHMGEKLGPMMLDITPHSLGLKVGTHSGFEFNNEILIRKNSPLPALVSRVFYRYYEEQDCVKIQVYQGESKNLEHNLKLGEFLLEGLSQSEDLAVHIKFQLDKSGLLHVTATDMESGKSNSHTLKRKATQRKQTVNLADICNMRIQAEDVILSEELACVEPEELTENHDDLIERACRLLVKKELDQTDAEELESAIAEKRANPDSEKLSELMYYLE